MNLAAAMVPMATPAAMIPTWIATAAVAEATA